MAAAVAVAVAVAAVVAVVREEKQEPSLSVSVVECRWIQLPLSNLRGRWMFRKCRRYRGNEMRGRQGLLLREELTCFDGGGKRRGGCISRRKEQITHQPHHHSLVVKL